jgi:hypothetical protein
MSDQPNRRPNTSTFSSGGAIGKNTTMWDSPKFSPPENFGALTPLFETHSSGCVGMKLRRQLRRVQLPARPADQ